jgi:hypothetical protein
MQNRDNKSKNNDLSKDKKKSHRIKPFKRFAKKEVQRTLDKAIKDFMSNKVESCFARMNQLELAKIPVYDRGNVQKVALLLLVGTLFDLTTLREILTLYGIKSNKYGKIWQRLSHKQVYDLFVLGSRQHFKDSFSKLLKQSESSQSRAEITIVGDDSVFKQWLKGCENEENSEFYGKFFSGQYKTTVYGFCVSVIGVVLYGTFYPLSFSLVGKPVIKSVKSVKSVKSGSKDTVKSAKQRKKSLVELEKQIKEVVGFLSDLSEALGVVLPQLYISVDSGFNDKFLLDLCDSLNLIAISVVKMNEIVVYKDKTMNFATLRDTVFLRAERKFYRDKSNEDEPFSLRLSLFYKKLNRTVTVLIFRFNGSDKITIIFCYDAFIKAKTLRRRFFQRTQIEQFFRMLKHTLKISQSKSDGTHSFIKKLAVFFLKAIFAFAFRDYCRKHFRRFKNDSFYKLRLNILHHLDDKSIMLDLF